jgi:hypothetical protein
MVREDERKRTVWGGGAAGGEVTVGRGSGQGGDKGLGLGLLG